jgi:hypothetical protein
VQGNFTSDTQLLPYSAPQDDPYAKIPLPTVFACSGNINVGPNANRRVDPGCYNSIDIKGRVTFSPGVYYIDGGNLDFGSQALVSGNGVTFVLTSSTAGGNPSSVGFVNINGGATVDLSATTTGAFAGVLFYQDPRATESKSNLINGNSSSKYQGAIYTPRQPLQFNGTSGMNTKCLQIVARQITFTGNSDISNVCPKDSGAGSFTGTRVRLVG